MIKIKRTNEIIVDGVTGKSIAENLILNNIFIDLPCAGKKKCGNCKVIATGELSDISEYERDTLSKEALMNNYRLACSAVVLGDVEISLPDNFDTFKTSGSVNVTGDIFVCIDLGTTNIEISFLRLYEHTTTKILSNTTYKNPLCSYGADVITRAEHSADGNKTEMKNILCGSIKDTLKDNHIPSPKEILITGNTTMLSLLTGTDCSGLLSFPFSPASLFGYNSKAENLNIATNGVNVYIPRCISAFVGADLLTACYGCDFLTGDNSVKLLIDIGTNGEIILKKGTDFYASSTAMGSAFEDSQLEYGVKAKPGAIYKAVTENNELKVFTIDNKEAIGVCAGGAVDILSCLKNLNIIDRTGLLNKSHKYVETINNQRVFKINSTEVYFTQGDIRNIQQAKAALCAGIKSLLKYTDTNETELDEVIITGSFGEHLNIKNAVNIGFLPKSFLQIKCTTYENLALKGLQLFINNGILKEESFNFAKIVKSINFSEYDYFNDAYIQCMYVDES